MSILLPCDLSTWPSVTSYLNVLASGLDTVQDVIVILLQIHDLCNVAILNEEDARFHDDHMFDHLFEVIENQFSPVDRERFLKKTLPCMARYAAALPQLRPAKFEYFLASRPGKVHMDRRFVASLAANAFMSTLPLKAKELWPHGMPDVTFATLFPALSADFVSALRFKGFLEYFDILEEEGPCGRISFELKVKSTKEKMQIKTVPRKSLAPVFIVEEDIRPLDMTANVECLVIKDLSNLSDMNLQHPELIPLLIIAEPKLKENEWFEIKNIMSRSSNNSEMKKEMNCTGSSSDDACICIVERTSNIVPDELRIAQESYMTILQDCYTENPEDENPLSSVERSKTASLSSKEPPISMEEEFEEMSEFSDAEGYERKPKRQCFTDRLKLALERGHTPDSEAGGGSNNLDEGNEKSSNDLQMHENRMDLEAKDANLNEDLPESEGQGSHFDEPNSFSDESVYSFESLIVPYDMDGDFEDLQAALMKPLNEDENATLRSLAIIEELKKMSLSDTSIDICLHLNTSIKPKKLPLRRTQSDLGLPPRPLKFRRQKSKPNEPESKLPVWIVNHSGQVDSKRFLFEWLAASFQDVSLLVYQSSNGSLGTDVVAAICAWIEEQKWTTEELFNALTQGGSSGGQFTSFD